MMSLFFKIIGEARLTLTGASVELFLNAMTKKHVEFWRFEQIDELRFCISTRAKDVPNVRNLAVSAFCNVESVQITGLKSKVVQLFKRPALLLSMAIVIFFSFYMQSFVFAMNVSGNETLHEEDIIRALEQHGICIGAPSDVDQQLTKHRMLATLPELSWIGVNRSGFMLNVLVTERSFSKSNRPQYPFGNIISAKDATITKQTILEGMKLCAVGDSVKKGQTLVSGFEDYGLILRGVCAEAEIYGQTWYNGVVASPVKICQKSYTGRQWRQYSLIVGRKRIYFFGNSSNLGTRCDKITKAYDLALPGYDFPVRLEIITYREYEQVEVSKDQVAVEERLRSAWGDLLLSQMIAGKIDETAYMLFQNEELYTLRCESVCNEMIARLVPMEPVFEGERNE